MRIALDVTVLARTSMTGVEAYTRGLVEAAMPLWQRRSRHLVCLGERPPCNSKWPAHTRHHRATRTVDAAARVPDPAAPATRAALRPRLCGHLRCGVFSRLRPAAARRPARAPPSSCTTWRSQCARSSSRHGIVRTWRPASGGRSSARPAWWRCRKFTRRELAAVYGLDAGEDPGDFTGRGPRALSGRGAPAKPPRCARATGSGGLTCCFAARSSRARTSPRSCTPSNRSPRRSGARTRSSWPRGPDGWTAAFTRRSKPRGRAAPASGGSDTVPAADLADLDAGASVVRLSVAL